MTLPILDCVQQRPVQNLDEGGWLKSCTVTSISSQYGETGDQANAIPRCAPLASLEAERQQDVDYCRVGLRRGFATPAKQSGMRWSLKTTHVPFAWDANHIAKSSTRAQTDHFRAATRTFRALTRTPA